MLIFGNAMTNLNRVTGMVTRLRRRKDVSHPDQKWLVDYICRDAAVVCCVQMLRFAEEIKWTPEKDWEATLRNRLTYGDVPRAKAIQLAGMALRGQFSDGLPAPECGDEIASVMRAILKNPSVAIQLPIAMDRLLMGDILAGNKALISEGLSGLSFSDEDVGIAQRVLSALNYATEVPQAFGAIQTPLAIKDTDQARKEL